MADFEPEPEDFNADPDELCPRCARAAIDPTSFYGWCAHCSERRPVVLKTSRQQRWRQGNGEQVDFSVAQLPRLERAIQTGLRSFVTVGNSLKAIKERRLYREAGFRSFESYCQDRWGFGREYAYRQIEASAFTDALSCEDALPQGNSLNERHVRELMRLPADEAREVWTELTGTYPTNLITGNVVKEEVDRRIGSVNGHVTREALCTSCGCWHPLVETRTTRSAGRQEVPAP